MKSKEGEVTRAVAGLEARARVGVSWLQTTPEGLGHHLPPTLTETHLLHLLGAARLGPLATRLRPRVTKEAHVIVKFASVIDLNLFLFFHGSQEPARVAERSWGSLSLLELPRRTFRHLGMEVEVRGGATTGHRRFGFKAREEEGVTVLTFKRTLGLVSFLFSPSACNMEVVAVRGVKHRQMQDKQLQEELKVAENTEKGRLAAKMVEHMRRTIGQVREEVEQVRRHRREVEREAASLEAEAT